MQHHFRIMFIYPGPRALGGITAVVDNYSKSTFSRQYGCTYFGTSTEGGRGAKFAYTLLKLLGFLFLVTVKRPEVVGIHTGSGISFIRKSLFGLSARMLGIPVVYHVHPSHFYDFYVSRRSLKKVYVRKVLASSEALVFLTEEMANNFRREFPDKKIFVLPNPVDAHAYQVVPRSPMEKNYTLLFLGWIIAGKGVYDIVDVMHDVIEEYPTVQFIFAGNKEVGTLRTKIRECGVEMNASVLGWVEREEKIKLLRSSRLLLLPTYTEGIPNVLLEAMASGLPAITTPVGGIPSVFNEGTNGYYITPGNKDALKAMILRLLGDDLECERLSRATQAASCEYDVETVGAKLEKIYRTILHQEEN